MPPSQQPAPTPKLEALQYMLDSEKTTPELRAWAVRELAMNYPGQSSRIMDAFRSSNKLEVLAAIEGADLYVPRYLTAVKSLQGVQDPEISAAAKERLAGHR